MAYKSNTVVISIPISEENNEKLKELANHLNIKSKTKLASTYIREAIERDYKKLNPDSENE